MELQSKTFTRHDTFCWVCHMDGQVMRKKSQRFCDGLKWSFWLGIGMQTVPACVSSTMRSTSVPNSDWLDMYGMLLCSQCRKT
jgi:hypothetical protein